MAESSLKLHLSQGQSQEVSQDSLDVEEEMDGETIPHGQKHLQYLNPNIKRDLGLDKEEEDDEDSFYEKESEVGDKEYEKDSEDGDKEENETSREELNSSNETKSESAEVGKRNGLEDEETENGVSKNGNTKENKGGKINIVMKEDSEETDNKENPNDTDASEDSDVEEKGEETKSKPKISPTGRGKADGDGKGDMEEGERGKKIVEIMGDIEDLRKKKRTLQKEIKEQSVDVEEANSKLQFRRFRMESWKEKKDEQEKEIKEQRAVLKRRKNEEIEVGSEVIEGVEEKCNKIKRDLEEMSSNVSRIVGGRSKASGERKGESEVLTLRMLQTSGKQVMIFIPEEMKIEGDLMKKELKKIDSITLTPYKENDTMDLISKIKICSPEENCVAVHILRWSAGDEIDDDDMMDLALDSLMRTLNLAIEKGKDKFEKQMVVIPPSMENNFKAMKKLEGKMLKEFKEKENIINLLEFQQELGKISEAKENDVWKNEEVVRAKILCDTKKNVASEYALRRILSEVAVKIYNNKNPHETCLECGLIHEKDKCVQKEMKETGEKKEPTKRDKKEVKKKEGEKETSSKRHRGSSEEKEKKKKRKKEEEKEESK